MTQGAQYRDIPNVTLIKGSDVHKHAYVLHGSCLQCQSRYYADHDRLKSSTTGDYTETFVNDALYLKLGQSLWVDRVFTDSVLNATYSFHASVSSFSDYWNSTFGRAALINITRRHIWQAFIAGTVRMVSQSAGQSFTTLENPSIDFVTQQAYELFAAEGIIQVASGHSCDECSQPQRFPPSHPPIDPNDYEPVRMCVVDGIVMSPTVSTYFFPIFGILLIVYLALCL